jgi:hypothetical protein
MEVTGIGQVIMLERLQNRVLLEVLCSSFNTVSGRTFLGWAFKH